MVFKSAFLILAMWVCCTTAFGAYRVWEDDKGRQVEAELVAVSSGNATLKNRNGKQFVLSVSSLCKADQEFVQSAAPPTLEIDVDKQDYDSFGYHVGLEAKVKQASSQAYGGKLKAVMLVIGELLESDHLVVLDKTEKHFSLPGSGHEELFQSVRVPVFKQVAENGLYPERYTDYVGYVVTVFSSIYHSKEFRDWATSGEERPDKKK